MRSGPELLEAGIVALVFGLALRGTPHDVLFAACRPRLLLRALITIDVLIPLLVMCTLSTLRLPSPVVIGATLVAISPGAPLVPQKRLTMGSRSELVHVWSMLGVLLAIVTVPIWLSVVGELLLPDTSIAPLAVTRLVSILFLLPLTLGIILRRVAPEQMARISGPMIVVGNLLLLMVIVTLGGGVLHGLRALGITFTIAVAVLSVGSVVIGHVAGGAQAADRSALGVMSGARHPGLALLIARYNFDGDGVLIAAVASFLIGTAVTFAYALIVRRRVEALPMPANAPQLATESPMLAPPAPQ